MKKAKTFLIALSVLAVVGGVVAFKAKVPRQFYQCDLPVLLCRINTSTMGLQTTAFSTLTTGYDELNKPCKFIANKWTCQTYVMLE